MSTGAQDNGRQRAEVLAYANAHDYRIVPLVEAVAGSGKRQADRGIDAPCLRHGQVQGRTVIVSELSRLGRSVSETVMAKQRTSKSRDDEDAKFLPSEDVIQKRAETLRWLQEHGLDRQFIETMMQHDFENALPQYRRMADASRSASHFAAVDSMVSVSEPARPASRVGLRSPHPFHFGAASLPPTPPASTVPPSGSLSGASSSTRKPHRT